MYEKRLWKKLVVILFAVVILVTLVACDSDKPSNPYSKTVREGWDMLASLDVLVRTEYNKDGNPIAREFYHVDTMEKESTLRYVYDNTGKLCDLVMGSDGFFTLLYDENGVVTTAFPQYDNDYKVSFTWDADSKLIAESVTNSDSTLALTYSENGKLSCEDSSKPNTLLKHTYKENGTKLTVLAERGYGEWTVAFTEAGVPQTVTYYNRTKTYTFNDKGLCTEIVNGKAEKVINSYNKNGDLVKQLIDEFDQNGEREGGSVCEFEYDNKGNLVKKTKTDSQTRTENYLRALTEWEYDAKGNKVKETVTEYDVGGTVLGKEISLYQYDEDDNRIQKTTESYEGEKLSERHEWDYTADGEWKQHIADTNFDDNGFARRHLVETYKERRKVVLSESTVFDSDGKPESYLKREYNAEGILTKFTRQSFVVGHLNVETTERYGLDEKKTQSVSRVFGDDGSMVGETTEEYYADGALKSHVRVYYDNGKPTQTEAEYYYEDGTKSKTVAATHTVTGHIESQETVEYNQDGKKTRVVHSHNGGRLYDRYIYEYEYYANGKTAKKTETEYESNGQPKLERYYIYNADGQLMEWTETEYKNSKQIKKTLELREYNDKGEWILLTILTYRDVDQLKSKTVLYLGENTHIDKEIYIVYDENGNEVSRQETVNP